MERLTHENSKVPSLCTIVQSCFAVAGNYRCENVDCCACIGDDDDYAERHRVKTAVDWSPNDSNSSSPTDPAITLFQLASDCDTRNIRTLLLYGCKHQKIWPNKNCEVQTSALISSIRSMVNTHSFAHTSIHAQLLTPTTHYYMVNC